MASRPVFVALGEPTHLVEEVPIDFHWNPGFAPIQKKKNVAALHEAASKKGMSPLLGIDEVRRKAWPAVKRIQFKNSNTPG